jgi:hypothetical protein
MDMVEESIVPTVFSHNRDRLSVHDVAGEFLRATAEPFKPWGRARSVVDLLVPGEHRDEMLDALGARLGLLGVWMRKSTE